MRLVIGALDAAPFDCIVISASAFAMSGGIATAVSAPSLPLNASRPSNDDAAGAFAAGATPTIVRRMARVAVLGRGIRDGLSLLAPLPSDPNAAPV